MEEFLTANNFLISIFASITFFWLRRIDKKFDKIDARFDKVDDELKSINGRLSHVEGILWVTHGYSMEDRRKPVEK